MFKALHYLTPEEETAIKRNIPWESIDPRARELVQLANEVNGIATLQSCAGHVYQNGNSFCVQEAHIAFRATDERTLQILFFSAPEAKIANISLRYFNDGTFWISVESDPAEISKLYSLFRNLNRKEEKNAPP